jgi:antitoxin component YwqK of YwqJK toxin-antitoxin module
VTQRRNTHLDGLPLATALALCVGLVLWIGRDQDAHAAAPQTLAMVPREVLRRAAVDVAAPQTPFGTRSVDELLEGLFDPPVLRREEGQAPPSRREVPIDDAAGSDAPAPEPRWVALQDGDGRVLAEGRMLGDLPDGPWLFRGAGGARLAAGVFQAGAPDGPWQAWHEDGSLRETLAYDEGLPEGLRVEWWPNGVKALEGRYDGGQRSGLWSSWHESGALRSQGAYEDGLREGAWTEWHADGGPRSAARYSAGRRDGAFRAWHANGAVAETGEFAHGLREGLWGFFTPDGQRERRSGRYVAGVRQRE